MAPQAGVKQVCVVNPESGAAARSKSSAYVLLTLTLIPWVFWIVFITILIQNPPDAAALENMSSDALPLWAWGMMLIPLFTFGLIVFYVIHLYTKSGLSGALRGLWLVLILFANLFAMPVYWFLYVKPDRDAEAAPPPPPLALDVHGWRTPALGNTAGELLDASIVLTKRNYWTILRNALPALVLAFTLEALLELLDASSGFLGTTVSLVPWSLVEALCLASCWCLLHGAPSTFAVSWQMISPRLGAVILSYALKWLAITVGLVLLIIPGFLVIVRFFGLPTACITEHASVGTAIRRSLALSRGRFKLLAASVGMVDILTLGLSMLIPLLVPGGSWEEPSRWDTISASLVYVGLLPFRTALLATVYLSLRMSKEGYDLSVSLGSLSRAAP